MKHLILGGAKSGKSTYAEQRVQSQGKRPIYIATAQAYDDEMRAKIAEHRARRGGEWTLVECPIELSQALTKHDQEDAIILVDCLTLWITNCLLQGVFTEQRERLLKAVDQMNCDLVMVSNEVGSGVIPMGELSRDFVNASGALHQALALRVEEVTLVVAGLPLSLKTPPISHLAQ